MRKLMLAVALVVVLVLAAACSSGGNATGVRATTTTSSPSDVSLSNQGPSSPTSSGDTTSSTSCALKPARDVIIWTRVPNLPDSAQIVGDVNLGQCTRTIDDLPATSPQDPGYCTKAAYADQNPGYNADAKPAAQPKQVVAQTGPGC